MKNLGSLILGLIIGAIIMYFYCSKTNTIEGMATWWSLEDMRNYLDYAENQAKNLGYAMDGVHVYLGVYGDNAPKDKAGYSTVFISPTGNKTLPEGTSGFAAQGGRNDIPGSDPLNDGDGGYPPQANYPQ